MRRRMSGAGPRVRPMPDDGEMLRLPEAVRTAMVEHMRAAHPEEGCGLLAFDRDGALVGAYCLANVDRSPTRFTVDPDGHFAAVTDAEARGWVIGGVFHSHPHGPAIPSPVDLASPIDPTWVHVIVGLADPERAEVRAWRVADGVAREIDVG